MISVEFDKKQLKELMELLGPELYAGAVEQLLTDVTEFAEGEVKELTPKVTGTLRRSIQSDVRKVVAPQHETRVGAYGPGKSGSRIEYAHWIETGETRDGRKMKTRPGGYRMFEKGAEATERELPQMFDRCGNAIAERWAS